MRLRFRTPPGLTLVELLVAVLVLSIAVVGTFRTLDVSGRQIGGESERLLARLVAANRAEELRLTLVAEPTPMLGQVRQGLYDFDVETGLETTAGGLGEATITVRGPGGSGAVLVTYLPAPAGGG
ncbi:type II secretion system protein GspI [Seohaeicola saemankumensis]|nr:type II secretion system protein [Seohaeicola saemankumensis]MCA0873487.1 type II secretion system protein GspI [Seohaeicola saemankumensis]